uniref:Uncharacterized protein n=1 Tax=Arundo donax TaxID=35708 RepID=A0A0A9GQN8_ARUDO
MRWWLRRAALCSSCSRE